MRPGTRTTPLLADLDPELHRLPLGIPAGVSGNDGWETAPLALSFPSGWVDEEHALRKG
jgi:hypothetical protein